MIFKTTLFIIPMLWNGFYIESTLIHMDGHTSAALEEKGKKQLESLEAKATLPRCGNCWLESLNVLHNGCRSLTDAVHIDIALRFTGCFMDMSGQEEPPDCISERTEPLKKLCMSQMSDRAFAVYTEFFTQTQNMCFYLQNQNWHIETERTINRLSSFSRAAGEQLELVNNMQNVLMHEQHNQFNLQIELLSIGRNLSESINGSQLTIEKLTKDLKHSTKQHTLVLEELFLEFHQLHRWIIGRYAFVDGLIFYFCFIFFVVILTSLKRTSDARGLLMAIILACMCAEWCMYKQKIVRNSILLDSYRWTIRQASLISSMMALLYYVYRFEDFSRHILTEIRDQNRQILEQITRDNVHPTGKLRSINVLPNNSDVVNGEYSVQQNCNVKNCPEFVIKQKLPKHHSDPESMKSGRDSSNRLPEAMADVRLEPYRLAVYNRYNLRKK